MIYRASQIAPSAAVSWMAMARPRDVLFFAEPDSSPVAHFPSLGVQRDSFDSPSASIYVPAPDSTAPLAYLGMGVSPGGAVASGVLFAAARKGSGGRRPQMAEQGGRGTERDRLAAFEENEGKLRELEERIEGMEREEASGCLADLVEEEISGLSVDDWEVGVGPERRDQLLDFTRGARELAAKRRLKTVVVWDSSSDAVEIARKAPPRFITPAIASVTRRRSIDDYGVPQRFLTPGMRGAITRGRTVRLTLDEYLRGIQREIHRLKTVLAAISDE